VGANWAGVDQGFGKYEVLTITAHYAMG
jgi:hypothetical protein